MPDIRIIAAPPSSVAPPHIREQWVGVVLPLADPEKPPGRFSLRIGTANGDGYVVETRVAVEALRIAGKEEAADFWEAIADTLGDRLIFKKEVCEPL